MLRIDIHTAASFVREILAVILAITALTDADTLPTLTHVLAGVTPHRFYKQTQYWF